MTLELAKSPLAPTDQLGDIELLATALNRSLSAATALYERFGGIHGLARAPMDDLLAARVPLRRVRQLWAALELGRRSLQPPFAYGETIASPGRVAAVMRSRLAERAQEELHVVGMDVQARIITVFVAGVGRLDEISVDPRDVFRPLVRLSAHRAIVVHNHPSGLPEPSAEDRILTNALIGAGELLGIAVVDHLIVARGGTYSFANGGPV